MALEITGFIVYVLQYVHNFTVHCSYEIPSTSKTFSTVVRQKVCPIKCVSITSQLEEESLASREIELNSVFSEIPEPHQKVWRF